MSTNTRRLQVRFARKGDLSDCISFDYVKSRRIVQNKIVEKEIVLATTKKETVGYLRLEYLWSKIPYIGLVMVKKAWRGIGVGKRMLHFLEDYLRDQGFKILLSSSQANEPRPQHWHRRMGFQECGVIAGINNGGIGEVFFRKSLNHKE